MEQYPKCVKCGREGTPKNPIGIIYNKKPMCQQCKEEQIKEMVDEKKPLKE
jgi:hypothetical protein